MPNRKPSSSSPSPGLAARRIAADIVGGVLRQKRPLDEQLEQGIEAIRAMLAARAGDSAKVIEGIAAGCGADHCTSSID